MYIMVYIIVYLHRVTVTIDDMLGTFSIVLSPVEVEAHIYIGARQTTPA